MKNHYSFDLSQFSYQDLIDLLNKMTKIADKKGVVVVMEDNVQITTYNLCSYRRKLSQTKYQ